MKNVGIMRKIFLSISVLISIVLIFVFMVKNRVIAIEENNDVLQALDIKINQDVEKYFYISDNETILQQVINVDINNLDSYDLESINLENGSLQIKSPIIQNKVAGFATILCDGQKLGEENYKYDNQTGIVSINNLQMTDINKKYKIIYGYTNLNREETQKIELNSTLTMKQVGMEEKTVEDKKEIDLVEKGNDVSLDARITDEIYKGYLYENSNKETIYNELYEVEISNLKNVNDVRISSLGEKYTYAENDNIVEISDICNTQYKQTVFKKENLRQMLGDEGKVVILNSANEVIAQVDMNTEEQENGEIVVNYDNIDKIQIVTTKPIQEGVIYIKNTKKVNFNTRFKKEQLERIEFLEESIGANESVDTIKMKLTNPKTQILFETNREELSTMAVNEDFEMNITLKSNQTGDRLFKNPIIKITLPEEVKRVELKEKNLLYDSNLEIASIEMINKELIIRINGEQLDYNEGELIGPVVKLKMNLILDSKMPSADKEFIVQCLNENEISEERTNVKIVSPKDVITVNTIEAAGIETAGETNQETVKLDINSEAKEMEVTSRVINNKGESIKNVNIIGNIGTDGTFLKDDKELVSNLNVEMQSLINTSNENVKIYYTENENATEDLNDANNQWQENVENVENINKYLITIDQMAENEYIDFSYSMVVPENLEYNQQAYEGYSVTYEDEMQQTSNESNSTLIELTTGQGPKLQTQLKAFAGADEIDENSIIRSGGIITYQLELENVGTEDARDVSISAEVPAGTSWYNDENDNSDTVEITVDQIKVGEKITEEFFLKVDENLTNQSMITVKANVNYNNIEEMSNEITNNIAPGKLTAQLMCVTAEDVTKTVGDIIEYKLILNNLGNQDLNELRLKWNISDSYEIVNQTIDGNSSEVNGEETLIDVLQANSSMEIRVFLRILDFEENSKMLEVSAQILDGNESYTSQVHKMMAYNTNNFDIELSANNPNGYVKVDDEINYNLTVTNNNVSDTYIIIEDYVPNELTIRSVLLNGVEQEFDENQNYINISPVEIGSGETITLEIKTVVNYIEYMSTDIPIQNKVEIINVNGNVQESNIIEHIIDMSQNNVDDPNNPNDPSNPSNPGGTERQTYKIRGKVWVDGNSDGAIQQGESALSNIKVQLVDIRTNNVVINSNGGEITATTNTSGIYELSDIPNGEYIVVFEYDTLRYTTTEYQKEGVAEENNSKASSMNKKINNVEKVYGITDTILINGESKSNINMGLIRLKEFDLSLKKSVSRVIVQSNSDTKVYSFNDEELAKIEMDAKNINGVNLIIEYKIAVTNNGEIGGYIRKVADYIPNGFEFSSQLNKDWYQTDGVLYNSSLTNEKIEAGDTKILTLTLTKRMTENDTGSVINTAELAETYNELGIDDINSVPGNKVQGEDDISSAELIISIRTGRVIIYFAIIIMIILIIGAGAYLIKTKVLNK